MFIRKTSFIGLDGKRYFCLFDDAMISMRYAWNLSHGFGLVWNEGERVEGFTNMLMTLYMSVSTALFDKTAAVLFIQLSGIVFLLVTAYFTMKIAQEIFGHTHSNTRDFFMILAFIITLSYYPILYWSLMGMENGLLAMLLSSALWVVIRFDDKPKIMPILPTLMGLAFFTRPDAFIPISLIMAYRIIGVLKQRSKKHIVVAETAIIAAFIVSITIFRWWYYGSTVPNTYTLKVGGYPLMFRIKNGTAFVLPYLKSIAIPLVIAIIGIGLNFRKSTFLLMLLVLSSIGKQIWVGGDILHLYWRMMCIYVPLLCLLCMDGVYNILHALFKNNTNYVSRNLTKFSHPLEKVKMALVAVITLSILVVANSRCNFSGGGSNLFLSKIPFLVQWNRKHVNTAIILNKITGPNASIAVVWAGALPYYSGLKAIDILGKSDKYIARLPPDFSFMKGNPQRVEIYPKAR